MIHWAQQLTWPTGDLDVRWRTGVCWFQACLLSLIHPLLFKPLQGFFRMRLQYCALERLLTSGIRWGIMPASDLRALLAAGQPLSRVVRDRVRYIGCTALTGGELVMSQEGRFCWQVEPKSPSKYSR